MSLANNLLQIVDRKNKRLGRGYGSGKGGHTSSRGQKGQLSRTGGKVPLWFEGGSLPLTKRLPMWRGKGRVNVLRPTAEITLTELNAFDFDEITLESLKLHKIIDKRFKKAKIIKKGKLNKKINVKGIKVSQAAQKEIIDLGGKIEE